MGWRMRRWTERKNILCGLGAVLGFALLFALTFHSRARTGQRAVELVAFGDSVFTDIGDMTAIPDRVAQLLDVSVYNASMGGTCAARLETERRLDSAKGSLSLVGLTRAIRSGDFDVQQTARIRDSNTESFPGIIDGLAEVDFGQVEVALIQKGVNDYHGGVPIDNEEDPYDEYTFLGALRSAVRDLRRVNPHIRILFITPTYTWYTATGLTCEETDNGAGVLEDYVNAQLGLAEELDVEAIDLYHDFFPHESWEDWKESMMDGLHPNEAGRERIAERIADILRSEKKQ